MHALFQRLLKRCNDEKHAERAKFDEERQAHEETTQRMQAEHCEEMAVAGRRLQEQAVAHGQQLAEERSHKARLEEASRQAEAALGAERAAHGQLQQAHARLQAECDGLRKKLEDSERNEELARRQLQIEALEKELRNLRSAGAGREAMKARAEAEALRQELMDYVKFILHILPDDLRPHVDASQKLLPQELKEKLAERAAGRGPRLPTSPGAPRSEALPPLGLSPGLATASATYFGGRGGRLAAGPVPSPRER
eukprot:SRR837773.6241.p1 GENE.SRR837773.6241~~SRR837773.6241.p1  ORF type:complete len:254 (+),score=78.16 SRR837773.6241:3-764(+)